jgi:hypothetical protein
MERGFIPQSKLEHQLMALEAGKSPPSLTRESRRVFNFTIRVNLDLVRRPSILVVEVRRSIALVFKIHPRIFLSSPKYF